MYGGLVTGEIWTRKDIHYTSEVHTDTLEMSGDSAVVTTVGRDDFFNDPFFKDWWADFDSPGKQLDRQNSGAEDRSSKSPLCYRRGKAAQS